MAKRIVHEETEYYEQLEELKKTDFGACSFIFEFNEYVRLFEEMLQRPTVVSELLTKYDLCKKMPEFNQYTKEYEKSKLENFDTISDWTDMYYYDKVVDFFKTQIIALNSFLKLETTKNEHWDPQIYGETNKLDEDHRSNAGLEMKYLPDSYKFS